MKKLIGLAAFLTITHLCAAQVTPMAPCDSVKIFGTNCGGAKLLISDTLYFAFCAKSDSVIKIHDHRVIGICQYMMRNLKLNCKAEYCTLSEQEGKPKWKRKGALLLASYDDLVVGLNMQCTDLNVYDQQMNLIAAYPLAFPFLNDNAAYYHNYFASKPIQPIGNKLFVQLLLNKGLGIDRSEIPPRMPIFGCIDLGSKKLNQKIPDTLSSMQLHPTTWFGKASKHINTYRISYFYNYFASYVAVESEGLLFYNDGMKPDIQVFTSKGTKAGNFGLPGKSASARPTMNIINATKDSVLWDYLQILNTSQYFGIGIDTSKQLLFLLYNESISSDTLASWLKAGSLKDNRDFERAYMRRPTHLQVYAYKNRKLKLDVAIATRGKEVLGLDHRGILWISAANVSTGAEASVSAYGYDMCKAIPGLTVANTR